MIEHQVLVNVERESFIDKTGPLPGRQLKTACAFSWGVLIKGDINDDPMNAVKLLQETQEQVDKIRQAYGVKTKPRDDVAKQFIIDAVIENIASNGKIAREIRNSR